jgi:hypothetical protein
MEDKHDSLKFIKLVVRDLTNQIKGGHVQISDKSNFEI